MTTDRSSVLFHAVGEFNQVHNDWADAKDNSARYPTLAYWRSFQNMVDLFQAGDLPADCRQLAAAVFQLAQQSISHDTSDSLEPPAEFWHARENLEAVLSKLGEPGQPVYRESIKELDKQGVPHEQIARMWGLKNADGTGRPHLVQKELDNPGSVIGPDYVHPDDIEAGEMAEEARNTYRAMRSTMTESQEEAATASAQPCPETSEELWSLPGMTIRQAAKMLKRTEDDVSAEWQLFESAKNADADGGREAPTVTLNDERDTVSLGDPATLDDGSEGDRYSQFSEWNYQQVKLHAKEECKIEFKGSPKREWLIDQILSLEVGAEPQEPLNV